MLEAGEVLERRMSEQKWNRCKRLCMPAPVRGKQHAKLSTTPTKKNPF